ncbi:AAA family ATPase [Actinoplanes cyaneus]|uniref:AAA family ATPase n=1 Tax=Actinoplanes cyaneus TaxID=52696 RepID=UPI0019425235|nr:AAA family ATPase [Actinoplanes cyaneus]
MSDDNLLLGELTARLRAARTHPPVTDLVLAAYRDAESLDMLLAGGDPTRPDRGGPGETYDPASVWLRSVQVEGFRGIGPRVTLDLRPAPGLTLVVGRNGSGKSSLAEATELVLTDDSQRWARRPVTFRQGWRNLHHDGPTGITIGLRVDGQAPVELGRRWPTTATDPAEAELTVALGGRSRAADQPPGWLDRIDLYRPFLSARDLERVITARPAELYDALSPILGLAPLSAADGRLQQRRRERADRVQDLRTSFTRLRSELGELDDDRARQALAALGRQSARADLTALAALVDGTAATGDQPAVAAARRLIGAELPDVLGAFDTLQKAESEGAALAGSDSVAAVRTTDLLQRALDLHHHRGDQPCPVCRTGRLDSGWRESAEAEIARLGATAAAARAAHDRTSSARHTAVHLLRAARDELGVAVAALEETLPTAAARLRLALADVPSLDHEPGGTGELGAVRLAWQPVLAAYADLAETATRWLVNRQDRWREPAASLRRWIDAAGIVRAEADALSRLEDARTALRSATDAIRAERLSAFVDHSEQIWQRLRQESNVELHHMRMEGVSTQRRVRFPVTVDGVETNALAVMSQGELHALGLAVFLPRACAPASPFRFVVVDDPVQSMDPAKVDGLAEVLGATAETRQVIVFTHDDRLPEALRRLGVPATVWEVCRRARSVVELRPAGDPAERYLDDARALAAAKELSEQARYPVVAGFCRSALEAISMDLYRTRRYAAGEPHETVEKALARAHTLRQRLALGLLDSSDRVGELSMHLRSTYGGWAATTVTAAADGAHGTARTPLPQLVTRTRDLVTKLR